MGYSPQNVYNQAMYLYEYTNWTKFTWDNDVLLPLLSSVRFKQGNLLGILEDLDFQVEQELRSDVLVEDIVASSKIEGVDLNPEQIRSSVAKQLGLPIKAQDVDTRNIDSVVSVLIDATKNASEPLTEERLFGWHNALFPTGYSGLHKIEVAKYRTETMQVVSGAIGHEQVHFQAVEASEVPLLMREFLEWVNEDQLTDPVIKAGIAHLWFLTIHPFDDGNGRIARAITEMLLARSDSAPFRFYAMANYILQHRQEYYASLEQAQKGTPDITAWLKWFLEAVNGALDQSKEAAKRAIAREAFWTSLREIELNKRQRAMLFKLKGDFKGKLTAAKWAKMQKVSHDTALRDINDLIEKGVLARSPESGRSTSYVLAND